MDDLQLGTHDFRSADLACVLSISGNSINLRLGNHTVVARRHCSTARGHEMLSYLGGVVGRGQLTRPSAAKRKSVAAGHAFAHKRIVTAYPPLRPLISLGYKRHEKHARFAGFAREDFVYG
jgi:hypothetical protein